MAGYNGTVLAIPKGYIVSITSAGTSGAGVLDAGSKGSLFIVDGSLILEGLTLKNGIARDTPGGNGGVLSVNTNGSAAFTRCSFVNNTAPGGDGGVAHVHSHGAATFTSCSFVQNSAGAGGGAVDVYLGSVRFVSCTFEEDSAGIALKYNGVYDGGSVVFGCPAGTTGADVPLTGNANTSELPPAKKIVSCTKCLRGDGDGDTACTPAGGAPNRARQAHPAQSARSAQSECKFNTKPAVKNLGSGMKSYVYTEPYHASVVRNPIPP